MQDKIPNLQLPEDYLPHEDEPFMCDRQRTYFRARLLSWKQQLLQESSNMVRNLQEGNTHQADLADRATVEIERSFNLRERDRARKLSQKIDNALQRLADGTYGYCEATNEPIALSRLIARPIATLTLEARSSMNAMSAFIATHVIRTILHLLMMIIVTKSEVS